jgi:hypothetical protein
MPSTSTPLQRDVAFSAASTAHVFPWRAVLVIAMIAGVALGFLVGTADAKSLAVQQSGDELTRLLQFMAIVKTAMAIAVAAVVAWRLAQPITNGLALAYVITTTTMFIAPGLIWQMQHVAAGALFFHGGLLGALVVAAKDGTGRQSLKRRFLPVASDRERAE